MAEKLKRLRAPYKARTRNLFLGIALILASLLGVWLYVSQNNRTSEFLISTSPIASGSKLTADSLSTADLNLGDSAKLYLRPSEMPSGSYLVFPVDAGQLIPKGFVSTSIIDERQPVVLSSLMPLPAGLKPGDTVNIWTSKLTDKNRFAPPVELVLSAEVTGIREQSGMFANQSSLVQLLVPSASVGSILDAIAAKDAISLVLQRDLGHE